MPPAKRQRTGSFDTQIRSKECSPFIAVEYDGRKVVIPRDSDYDKTIASIQRVFGDLRKFLPGDIMLFVHLEQIGDSAEVTKVLWSDMVMGLVLVKVVLRYGSGIDLHPTKQIRVKILMRTDKELSLSLPTNCQIEYIREVVFLRTFGDPLFKFFSLYLNGEQLLRERRLNDYHVEDGDQIDVWHPA